MIILSPEELRGIITGEIGYRKCPDCYGEGTVYFIDDEKQTQLTAQQYADCENEDKGSQECDLCKGVGYIPIAGKW